MTNTKIILSIIIICVLIILGILGTHTGLYTWHVDHLSVPEGIWRFYLWVEYKQEANIPNILDSAIMKYLTVEEKTRLEDMVLWHYLEY